MTKRLTTGLLLTAALATAGCRVERTERPTLADAGAISRADIQATLDAWITAVRAGDVRRAATYFAPDATVTRGGVTEVSGRDAIAGALTSMVDGRDIIVTGDAVELSTGSAYQMGSYEVTAEDSTVAERGRFVIRWVRGPEGSWRMHHMLLAPFVLPAADSATGSQT